MEIPGLVRTLLEKRGITTVGDIQDFLNPDYELHTHDPFLLEGMDRAVTRVFAALQSGERIAVYGDFDCDGIPGSAVLSDFFKKIGYQNVEIYIPHRDREGYGFHIDAIQELASRNVSLIITVDVGTTALESVRFAKEKGIDVIVTDHHEILGALPDAIAVINPKLGNYPFRDLCGAAVAFKLVEAMLAEGKKREIPNFTAIVDGWEKWLLDLVAIATIADMVPLVGENRVFAHFGLKVLNKTQRPGLLALFNKVRARRSGITEDDVGFLIAPRINAASRMDEPDLAFSLLTTQDPLEAETLAAHLEQLNTRRKGVVASVVKQARKNVHQRFTEQDHVVVLGNPEWKPALLGLAANSIMEERGGVVCLWGRDAKGNLKGSCRSDGSVSLAELFSNADAILEEYGGHAHSGGFSVSHDNVHTLPETLAHVARQLERKTIATDGSSDALTTLPEISSVLFKEVSQLAPFGIGNPKPVFQVCETIITSVRRFGREDVHVELQLECRRSGVRLRAFDYFRKPEGFTIPATPGLRASILGTIEKDAFRGGLVLRLVDILEA